MKQCQGCGSKNQVRTVPVKCGWVTHEWRLRPGAGVAFNMSMKYAFPDLCPACEDRRNKGMKLVPACYR